MIGDLGWSKAKFASLGVLSLIIAFVFPVVGRMADLIGVRRTVLIGIVALPVAYVALSLMTGPVWQYVAIQLGLGILTVTTSTTVYTRIAVQSIRQARGLALAIVASGPAMTGTFLGPIMNRFVEAHDWRTSYQVLALYAAVTGMITLALLPRELPATIAATARKRIARTDYPLIFRSSAFWILLVAMLLCNLPQIVAMSQLKMVLMEHGIAATATSIMLAALPLGVLAGRFVSGYALDRAPAYLVGFIGLSLPSVGLFIFATQSSAAWVLTLATISIGFAVGAEGDIVAYIVARRFGVDIYSSVMGMLTMAISFSVALGSAILALSLKLTGGYRFYMLTSGTAVLVGSLLFLLLRSRTAPPEAAQAA